MHIDPISAISSAVITQPLTPNPTTVARFDAAMNATPTPLVNALTETWVQAAETNHTLRTRITALADTTASQGMSLQAMAALQYEVASLSFQQEVVTQIAKKATDTVSTLIKNS